MHGNVIVFKTKTPKDLLATYEGMGEALEALES